MRGHVRRVHSACSPRGHHGAALWEGTPGIAQGPPGLACGPRTFSNHLPGVDFPGEGRIGSFWFPLRQEGKLRRGTVSPVTLKKFNQQLM